nr:pyridoxal kinase [Nakamurella alba]
MRILSIQSSVAYGHVGNSAATFPLQRLGHEVWPVLTVHFSNHTGYGEWRGPVFAPEVVGEVIDGIADRGALDRVDAVLTGYQGSPGVAEVILSTVARVRAANPAAVYCCDPVMGDVGRGMFVLPGLPELIRDRVVPVADVITPNVFELAFLAGTTPEELTTVPALLDAVDRVRATGPRTVLVTSVELAAIAPGAVPGVVSGAVPVVVSGTGPDTGGFDTDGFETNRSDADRSDSDKPGADKSDADKPGADKSDAATDTVPSGIGMLAVDDTGAFLVRTPLLPLSVNGAGDVTAALFLAHLPDGIRVALERVASSVFAILDETARQGSREIRLIDAQGAIADPACEFPAERLR